MDEKELLLKEIASLIDGVDDSNLELNVMNFMSLEELTSIKNSLLQIKNRRPQERESWYNEWAEKCAKR